MSRKEKLLRTTMSVTLVIIFSKALGFLRDTITANYFGTGDAHDAYQAAYSLFYLPVLLLNSCITSTVVPMYVEDLQKRGRRRADRFGSNTLNIFTLFSLVIGALMFVFARPLVSVVHAGFAPEKADLTAHLARIMLLTLLFNVASIVIASLLNAREKYIAAQITGFPLSVAVILAAVLFSDRFGVEALAWGVCAANLLQTLVLIPFLTGWFRYTHVLNLRDPRFRRLMQLAVPAIFSMAVSELSHMVDQNMASGIEGGISALTLAYRLITFMTGILIVPLTTIMFSRMSKLVSANDRRGILEIVRTSIVRILLIMMPIVAVAAVANVDVIKLAYMRGKFNEASLIMTSGAFLCYVVGVISFGLRDLLNRAFHAMQDTRTTLMASILSVLMNIGLNFPFRVWFGVKGLALSTSVSGTVTLFIMFRLLKNKVGHMGFRKIMPDFLKITAATIACAAVAMLLNGALPEASGTVRVFFRLSLITGASVITYAVCCYVFGVEALREYLSVKGGKKGGSGKANHNRVSGRR